MSEKEQCNCIAVCQAEPLARRSLLPGLPAPAAAGGIGDSNGDPCPDAGDRVANIIIIVVVITATTSPIIFQGSSDLLRAPPKPLLRGVSGAPRAMAHAEAEVQDNLEAVVDLIGPLHRGNIQWYNTLNNSTSTRPKDHGGIVVKSMGKLRKFQPLADGRVACTLSLPYVTATGRSELQARGEGNAQEAASEECCKRMVAKMLAADPRGFTLREKHWTVDISEVVRQVNAVLLQPLEHPVALPPNRRGATGPNGGGLRGREMDREERDAEVYACIWRILASHGGKFNPARIAHHKFAAGATGVQKAYVQLDELLARQELWDWVQASDAFDCVRDGNSMVVSWAASSAASGATSSADHAPAMLAVEDASRAPTAECAEAASGRDDSNAADGGGWGRGWDWGKGWEGWGQRWGQNAWGASTW